MDLKRLLKKQPPPTPECAQSVKAQGLCKALRINTPLEHLSPPLCENINLKTNPRIMVKHGKGKTNIHKRNNIYGSLYFHVIAMAYRYTKDKI